MGTGQNCDTSKTVTRQNGDNQNGVYPITVLDVSPFWLYQNRQQNQNSDTPKTATIQLDVSPKRCVDLYPKRRHAKPK